MTHTWSVPATRQVNIKLDGRKTENSLLMAAVGRGLRTVLLALPAAACLLLAVPYAFGYHIYTVSSGSMEPAIPIGSLLYIQEAQPEDIQENDVIAYYGSRDPAAVIIHRVVENRVLMGEFTTKGDANPAEDRLPVNYADFIGKVRLIIPWAGKIALCQLCVAMLPRL